MTSVCTPETGLAECKRPRTGAEHTRGRASFIDDMTAGLLEILQALRNGWQNLRIWRTTGLQLQMALELLLTALNRRCILLPIPFALAEMQAGQLVVGEAAVDP